MQGCSPRVANWPFFWPVLQKLAKFQMLRPGTLNSSGQVYHTRSLTKRKPGQKNSKLPFNWPGKKAKLARRSLRNLATLG